jgi:apolipoprotein N-acyltransferase
MSKDGRNMTTKTMPAQQQRLRSTPENEPAVRMIIASARSAPVRGPARGAWLLSLATGILLLMSFPPLDWGPLAWVAIVPLVLLVRIPTRTKWMYRAVYGGGFAFTLIALQWMRLASTPMYAAWLALAVYVAMYFPLFVALSRVAVHRFSIPLTLAVPVVWVGLEFARAYMLTGFSWYYLGHTQYRWVELIQISDVVGAYGVSFLVALLAACLAGLLPVSLLSRLKLLVPGEEQPLLHAERSSFARRAISVTVCVAVFAAVLGYGFVRRGQANFVEGPLVALVEANFTASMKHDPTQDMRRKIFEMHHKLTGMAVKKHPVDLIVWPETMYRAPLMVASPDLSDEELQRRSPPGVMAKDWRRSLVPKVLANMSRQSGAAMIVGIETWTADDDGFRRYNSATFTRPDVGLTGRYDKMHRVIFGEYVPLAEELPWLASLSPMPVQFQLSKGKTPSVFEYKGMRYAPIICFEDTVPHLMRRIAKSTADWQTGKPVDCFVNLTNDGWFHGSAELDQHLITAQFRCVETRTPMVRAVNTGISAIIDGDGVVVEPDDFIDGDGKGRNSMRDPKTGKYHKQLNAVIVSTVPLDDRRSCYVVWGDWFAMSCGLMAGCVLIGGLIPRRRRRDKNVVTDES